MYPGIFCCIQAFRLKMILQKFEVSRCSLKCSNSDFKLDAHSAMIGQFMWLLDVFCNYCIPFMSILKKIVILLSFQTLGWHKQGNKPIVHWRCPTCHQLPSTAVSPPTHYWWVVSGGGGTGDCGGIIELYRQFAFSVLRSFF